MGIVVSTENGAVYLPPSAKSYPIDGCCLSNQRQPSDPYFYADVKLQNIVVGSAWMLGYYDSGTFTELSSGTAVSTDLTISNMPSYGSPFLLELRVRKSSSGIKYKPLKTFTFHSPLGVTIYVSQVVDTVAI